MPPRIHRASEGGGVGVGMGPAHNAAAGSTFGPYDGDIPIPNVPSTLMFAGGGGVGGASSFSSSSYYGPTTATSSSAGYERAHQHHASLIASPSPIQRAPPSHPLLPSAGSYTTQQQQQYAPQNYNNTANSHQHHIDPTAVLAQQYADYVNQNQTPPTTASQKGTQQQQYTHHNRNPYFAPNAAFSSHYYPNNEDDDTSTLVDVNALVQEVEEGLMYGGGGGGGGIATNAMAGGGGGGHAAGHNPFAAMMMGGIGGDPLPLPPSNLVRSYAQMQRKEARASAGHQKQSTSASAAAPSPAVGSGGGGIFDKLSKAPTLSSMAKQQQNTLLHPLSSSVPPAATAPFQKRTKSPATANKVHTASSSSAAGVGVGSAVASRRRRGLSAEKERGENAIVNVRFTPVAADGDTNANAAANYAPATASSSFFSMNPSSPSAPPLTPNVSANEAVAILVQYKQYVEQKLTPQLQKYMSEADGLRAELSRRNRELEEKTNALEESKGTISRLRLVLDQERLSLDDTHADHIKALESNHAIQMKLMKEEMATMSEQLIKFEQSGSKLVQLERLLEMRDGEIRRLRVAQQQRADNNPEGLVGDSPSSSSTAASGGGGGGLTEQQLLLASSSNAAATDSTTPAAIANAIEQLVQESTGYLNAITVACAAAGVNDAFGPSGAQWRAGAGHDLMGLANTLRSASLSSRNSATFAFNVCLQAIHRLEKCLKDERGCVAGTLSVITSTHADTLGSVGARELELAKIRDVHQQRIEELERDFDTQLRLLQSQLQHQGQYMHGAGIGIVGGGGATASSSAAGGANFLSPISAANAQQRRFPTAANNININRSDFDEEGVSFGPSGWGSTASQGGGGRGPSAGSRALVTSSSSTAANRGGGGSAAVQQRSCATQTILDVGVLFPGVNFGGGAGASSGAVPNTHHSNNHSAAAAFLARKDSFSSAKSGGGNHNNSNTTANATGVSSAELLTSEEIDGTAVQRLVSELLVLETENAVLREENAILKEERRRHLFFSKMGNVPRYEQALLAHGSVADLLLQS